MARQAHVDGDRVPGATLAERAQRAGRHVHGERGHGTQRDARRRADPRRAWTSHATCLALFALLLADGCDAPSPQPGSAEQVKLELIDEAAFAKVLEGHRGKVVLVDFWATWCRPCVEAFPHTVQLYRRLADRGLAVISVSFDDPDDGRAAALEFLVKQEAVFQNYISPYGAGTQSVAAFELDGPLPQMKLYDRQGRLRQTFGGKSGTVDLQQLDRAVEELLGET